jgi:rhodanese-related sulfurtransferase
LVATDITELFQVIPAPNRTGYSGWLKAKGIAMTNAVVDIQSSAQVSPSFTESAAAAVLEQARQQAAADNLPYAGSVTPQDAWALFQSGEAVLIDVRTAEERKFVGHVPETKHVAWMTGLSLSRNPRFVRELESKAGKDDVVLLLCRSGKRSAAAAEAAAKGGFTNVFNILEGFEGDLDDQQRRGAFNGWRSAGLPWIQD